MYTAIIDKHPPISVVSLIFSFKNIFENIIVISGTTNINELAFTAPIFEDAKNTLCLQKPSPQQKVSKYLPKISNHN